MPAPRRVVLVRHGQTAWNAEGRWQGSQDIPLSERGREQGAALGRRFRDHRFDRVVSSSLVRAKETASLASGRESHEIEPALVEISYGAWEGVVDADVRVRWPELRKTWGDAPDRVTMEGGESLARVEERAWPAFEGWVRRAEGDILVVAHGGVNRVLLSRILGLSLSSFWRIAQDPSAVNVIELGEGADVLARARVKLVNCTAHLAD